MTAVFITVYRQRTQPKIYEERSVQGQINQIILIVFPTLLEMEPGPLRFKKKLSQELEMSFI